MNKFNLLYEQIISNKLDIIKEGGNAFKDVSRINKEYINDTIETFKETILDKVFKIDLKNEIFLLGSTGKKPSSGDIDIAIDLNYILKNTKFKSLNDIVIAVINFCQNLSYDVIENAFSNDIIHISFPQIGNLDELVQIDLLFTLYPDFTKFYMFSPTPEESKYKGAHRNELLRAIAKIISYKILKIDSNDIPVTWKQYDISKDGIEYNTKTLMDTEGNRLKYRETDENLETSYAKSISTKVITHKVRTAIDMLIGKSYTYKDIDTFEKLFNIINTDKNFKYTDKKYDILHMTALSIQENNRLSFPKELKKYLK